MSKKTAIIEGPGGGLPGSGRTPKALQLKNYPVILNLLDENAESALKVLINGLSDDDPWIRIRCAETILKKYIPDKKIKEIGGIGGGPIEVTSTDKRAAVISVINILDEIDIDDLKKKASNGDFRLFESDTGTKGKQEETMGEEKGANIPRN